MLEPQKTKPEKKPQARGFHPHAMAQAQALNQQPDSIPAMMKPGEYVLPPDTVAAMGGPQALDKVVDKTHIPGNRDAIVPRGFEPKYFFEGGGAVYDPKRPNWTFYNGPPAQPEAPRVGTTATAPQPSTAVAVDNRPNFTIPQNEPPRPSARPTAGAQDVRFISDRGPGNPNIPAGGMSAEARDFQAKQAANVGPQPSATPGAAPAGTQSPVRGAVGNAVNATRGFLASASNSGLGSRVGQAARIGGAATTVIPEVLDTASVAMNPDATGTDVATQAAEGVGRIGATVAGGLAGAKTGAVLGALGGPFAPVTVPLGGVIGGIAGGVLGGRGADAAIRAGRDMADTDTRSPVQQLASGTPEKPGTTAAMQNAGPNSGQQLGPTPPTEAAPQPAVQQVQGLPGVYQHGRGQYSDNAQGMGFTPGFTGQPSARNMQAAGNLSARQQAQSAARVAAAQQEPVARGFPGFAAPEISHSGNDWSTRNELRSLRMAAERAMESAPRKRFAAQHPAVQAYQAALQADMAARTGGQAALQAKTNDTNAGLVREQMQQQGATQRDMARNAIDQQRVGLDGQRLGLDAQQQQEQSTARGFDIRQAQRKQSFQEAWEKGTKEQREQLQQMYPDLMPTDKEKPQLEVVRGRNNPMTGESGQDYVLRMNPNGTVEQVPVEGMGQSQPKPMPKNKGERVVGSLYVDNNGQLVRWTEKGAVSAQ